MTMLQAVIVLAVAGQEGRTAAQIGEEVGATGQAVGRACQSLSSSNTQLLLPSQRWWRRPKVEGRRLGLIELRLPIEGRKGPRTIFLTAHGRRLVEVMERIVSEPVATCSASSSASNDQ